MPLAGGKYKDFGACVTAQRNKGKSPESARRICGKIKQLSEGTDSKQKHASDIDATTVGLTDQMRASMLNAYSELYGSNDSYHSNLPVQPNSMATTFGLLENESYEEKVARIIRERGVEKEVAEAVVDKLVAEEAIALQKQEFELKDKLAELEAQEELASTPSSQEQQESTTNENSNNSSTTNNSTATN